MKTLKIIYLIAILPVILFSACEKEGLHITPKIKAINKEFSIKGFVLGDTIEQYFDGVKMREYYGQVKLVYFENQLAFEKEEINMELRRKSTGETIYRQTFNINDKQNVVPEFYFDGLSLAKAYTYPDPQGDEYTANFYLTPSGSSAEVDVDIDVLEYYYDATKPDPLIVVNTTTVHVAEHIKPGKWTPYFKLQVPVVSPQQSGTELYPIVVLRDAKTKDYYVNKNRDQSTVNMELPYDGVSPGKVQSVFLNKKTGEGKKLFLEIFDLVQLFPR